MYITAMSVNTASSVRFKSNAKLTMAERDTIKAELIQKTNNRKVWVGRDGVIRFEIPADRSHLTLVNQLKPIPGFSYDEKQQKLTYSTQGQKSLPVEFIDPHKTNPPGQPQPQI